MWDTPAPEQFETYPFKATPEVLTDAPSHIARPLLGQDTSDILYTTFDLTSFQ